MRPILLLLAALLWAGEAAPVLPKPSANAGRTGSYQADTRNPANKYWVCVPSTYDGKRAAGLHVYFHGQGGSGSAQYFGSWQKYLLEPYCLIGINMQYTDNDNGKDTPGKTASALEAALQVMADYKIVPGRGMTACFSGGGLPCGGWYALHGKTRGLNWPFTALGLYGANFWTSLQAGPPTGWFIGVGTKEWSAGKPTLGTSQTARMGDALKLAASFGPDLRFLVVPDQTHTISDTEVAAAAEVFRRADLAHAPFIYAPDYPEKPLVPLVAQANAGQLGTAATALGKLKEGSAPAEQIASLTAAIDARATAQVKLLGELADKDPLLAAYYGNLFAKSLKGHAQEAALKAILDPMNKERKRATASAAAFDAFAKAFPQMFPSGDEARVSAVALPVLDQVLKAAGETSQLGAMAKELLALPHDEAKAPAKK